MSYMILVDDITLYMLLILEIEYTSLCIEKII